MASSTTMKPIEHQMVNQTDSSNNSSSKATDHTGRWAAGRRRPSRLLVSSEAQTDSVVRLDRSKWPPVVEHQLGTANRTNNTQEISDNNSRQQPLIHTDQLNATSPLLIVLAPQNSSRLMLDRDAAESAFAPSRVATLAASYVPPQETSMDPLEPAEGRRLVSVAPRLEVLNLEVANTKATLTWSLALFPTQSDTETATHSSSTGVDEEPSTAHEFHGTGEDNRIQITTQGVAEPPVSATTAKPLKVEEEEEPIDSAHSDLLKVADQPSRHQVTKRDTIKVRPTLNRQAELDRSPSKESSNEEKVYQAASSVIEDLVRATEAPERQLDLQDLPVSKRMQLSKVQTLPASNGRRPPARNQPQIRDVSQHQVNADPDKAKSSSVITESSNLELHQRPRPPKPNHQKSHRTPKEVRFATSSTTSNPVLTASPISEPPMIRTPSVPINRITGRPSSNTTSTTTTTTTTTSTTSTTTTTTTQAPSTTDGASTAAQPVLIPTTSEAPHQAKSISNYTTTSPLDLVNLIGSESSVRSVNSTKSRVEITTPQPTIKTPRPAQEPLRTTTKSAQTTTTTLAPSTKRPNAKARSNQGQKVDSSKWLVRLRRFASNEVDIVKVVVNNLGRQVISNPIMQRHITFKNLEPSSGYEICIESASPSQQVGDRFQIFDANHFLKCHDTSHVRLTEAANSTTTTTTSNALRPLDMSSGGLDEILEEPKLKSLCKEFFTLPAGSSERINFGAPERQSNGNATTLAGSRILRPNVNETNTGNPRRAKSLQSALKSRIELLEINDMNNPRQSATFEMAASRGLTSRLMPLDSHNDQHLFLQPLNEREIVTSSARNDYLSVSALPIVGCIFALVFIVTLANIILNVISCRSLARPRRAARASTLIGTIGTQGGSAPKRHLGSFYSDSENSATSQSRIVVVGKHGQPFAASSAYFEMPVESSPLAERLIASDESQSSSNGSGGKHSSRHLLSNASAARFQLGPSFEGDAKHNADMVGLARKNYDNIINNIYNRDELSSAPESLATEQHSPVCKGKRSNTSKRTLCQAHQSTRPRQLDSSELMQDLAMSADETYATNALISSDHHLSTDQLDSDRMKKQRIRFDKINPIYNMESLYTASSNGTRCRSPSNRVSSFGHLVSAKSQEVIDDQQMAAEHCSLCTESPSKLAAEAAQSAPDGCNCEDEDHTSTDQTTNSAYYTCCLDRQKQRFEKQQQQLEMVMTKNGSLIPQPFINPSGPEQPSEQLESQQEQVEELKSLEDSPLDHSEATKSREDLTYYQFGDAEFKQATTPLPASANRSLSVNDNQEESRKTLVPIGALANKQANEAIKCTDFDQRRNELASKLHLAGMSKPRTE